MFKIWKKLCCTFGFHENFFKLMPQDTRKILCIRCRYCEQSKYIPKVVIERLDAFDGWIDGMEPDF